MKDFFKYVFATVVGIVLTWFFAMFMFVVMMILGLALGSATPSVSKNSVLRIALNGDIVERAEENPIDFLMGKTEKTLTLTDIRDALKEAATNKRVKGVYLDCGLLSTDYAIAEELHAALKAFKESGKFVVAYGDSYSQMAYYVASAADKIYLNPVGLLDWHGIASEPIFYKEMLDKIGVKMQVFKVGTYKSAVEPYMLTEMSAANREQVTAFIGDIWQHVCADVSAARNLPTDSLNAFADRYAALTDAQNYLAWGLVDSLVYVDEVRADLRTRCDAKEVHFVEPAALASLYDESTGGDQVAVYYAEGSIVDDVSGSLTGSGGIVGSQVVSDLDALASDDDVKAVVLRINSGGGSAYASEQMLRAVQELRKKKPVVVSMSGMAASGGYYMSCMADYIVAEPTTLTGSIGIFGVVPDVSGLMKEKLGLHFDVVKTNESADFGSMGRGFNAGESQAMQTYVERGYSLFLQRVAEGRKLTTQQVDSIAQGRVWTGSQALAIGLVDALGGLDDAVAQAAKLAKIEKYSTIGYQNSSSWLDRFLNEKSDDYMERRLKEMLGIYYRPLQFVETLENRPSLQARIPFDPNLK